LQLKISNYIKISSLKHGCKREKFNIIHHKGKVNQNNIEILPHHSQSDYNQENKTTNAEEDAGKMNPNGECWWESNLVQPLQKSRWNFLKKLKIELSNDPAISILRICSKESKSTNKRDTHNHVYSPTIH
jgi:hypothetical protein